MPKQILKFPEGFLWGSASSAYQTEGNNVNSDWWEWEHSLKRENFLRAQGKDPESYRSGIACDFFNRYDEDFGLAEHLGHNAIRFGIEWSRLQPKEGVWDEKALDRYEKMLQSAKFHGLTVFLTLHHYTSPIWFARKGGFEKKENLKYFYEFGQRVVNRLNEYVDFWITFNEPELYVGQRYVLAIHPPQVRSFWTGWKVANNLISAHNALSGFIRQNYKKPVSMALNQTDLEPSGFLGGMVTGIMESIVNKYFLRRTVDYCDYIGVNYYFHHHVSLLGVRHHTHTGHLLTDRGWGIHPEGIEQVLLKLKKYNKPIYVVENGIADSKDANREKFIKDHLFYVHKAIQEGVDVRGYLYWSLTDNFEWEEGFWPRFGLIEVDRNDLLRRKVRYSALKYAEICKSNQMEYSVNL